MIDVEGTVRAWLMTLAKVQAAFGTRVYAARYLPSGYLPAQGPAALFMTRGGGQDFSSHLLGTSIQFRIYAATEGEARKAAQALYDAANDQQARNIGYCRMETGTMPTLLSEPGSDWPYVLMYFRVFVQN